MSAIGRFFVFVNLVLSVIFLACGAMLLAKSDDYRGQLKKEKEARVEEADGLKKQITAITAERDDARRATDQYRNEKNTADTNLEQTKTRLAQSEEREATLRKNVDLISANLENFRKNIDSLQTANTDLQKRVDDLDAKTAAAEKAKEEAENALAQAAAAGKGLEELNGQLKADLKRTSDELTKTQTALQVIQHQTGTPISAVGIAAPLIEGQVVDYHADTKLVQLNVGADSNVQLGYGFKIYSGAEFKGEAIVEQVQPKFCVARITAQVQKSQIKVGDKATTRL